MPILNIQLSGQAQAADGTPIQIAPTEALVGRGPCLQVTVNVAKPIADQLLLRGQTLPPPASGFALIDTGATTTCIDEDAARRLELPVVNVVQVASASHASSQQNVSPIQVEIVGTAISIDAPQAIGAALAAQGFLVLIGRDVLQHCTLHYNGPAGQITLSL